MAFQCQENLFALWQRMLCSQNTGEPLIGIYEVRVNMCFSKLNPNIRSKAGVRHVANLMSYECLGDPESPCVKS